MARVWSYFLLALYAYSYNKYFGNNWTPQSPEECICDGIFTLAIIIALLMPERKVKP